MIQTEPAVAAPGAANPPHAAAPSPWSYAEVWEDVARALPDAPALIQGDRRLSYAAFDRAADALAAHLLAAGLGRQARVALHLVNCPEYLIGCFAAFKAGLVPFNVNYRYGPDELLYLLDNADAEAVVFGAAFAPRLAAVRPRLPLVRRWLAVADPDHPLPDWAIPLETVLTSEPAERPVRAAWGRSGDDLIMIYTGGTTGMPKGVMWRQEDQFAATNFGANPATGTPPLEHPSRAGVRARALPRSVGLVASPLMHATGLISAFGLLNGGGAVVTLPGRKFDPIELWDEVERLRVTRMSIVGQAFATPMLDALDAHPGRWDLSSLLLIGSSGAMWSRENKAGLLRHLPHAQLMDNLASSEAWGLGSSTSVAGAEEHTAKFVVGPRCAVFTEDGRRVRPGSGERGRVAVAGPVPIGYHKDPEKSAKTFPVYEGLRWSVPGDWAEVEADGTLRLLGRGNQSINTGGEKVFPEEVEEALKRHDAIRDAAVVGLPDPRFGERICAIVEPRPGASVPPLIELQALVRSHLADYKAPRALVIVESVGRAPNGKLDYRMLKSLAEAQAAGTTPDGPA